VSRFVRHCCQAPVFPISHSDTSKTRRNGSRVRPSLPRSQTTHQIARLPLFPPTPAISCPLRSEIELLYQRRRLPFRVDFGKLARVPQTDGGCRGLQRRGVGGRAAPPRGGAGAVDALRARGPRPRRSDPELHLLGDLLRGLRGGRVALTFHPESQVYHRVASKCRSLHGRWDMGSYLPRGCRCAGSCLYRRKLLMIFPMLQKNLVAQVPRDAVAGESSSADVVPEHLRQTAVVHLSEVGVNQSHKLIITIKNLELRSSCCCAFVVSLQ